MTVRALLSISIVLFAVGCGSHVIRSVTLSSASTYPNMTSLDVLYVAADPYLDPEKSILAFDLNLPEKDVLALLLVIDNQGQDSYHLSKSDIRLTDAHGADLTALTPAELAARFTSTFSSSSVNQLIRADFDLKSGGEDLFILPTSRASTFLFYSLPRSEMRLEGLKLRFSIYSPTEQVKKEGEILFSKEEGPV